MVNFLKNNKNLKNLRENYNKILICFSPVIPHFTDECLSEIGYKENIHWPDIDKNLLEKNEVNFVIQINGKKRVILKKQKDISEKELLENVKKNENVKKFLSNKKIKKIIFVKNRLMNILLENEI